MSSLVSFYCLFSLLNVNYVLEQSSTAIWVSCLNHTKVFLHKSYVCRRISNLQCKNSFRSKLVWEIIKKAKVERRRNEFWCIPVLIKNITIQLIWSNFTRNISFGKCNNYKISSWIEHMILIVSHFPLITRFVCDAPNIWTFLALLYSSPCFDCSLF